MVHLLYLKIFFPLCLSWFKLASQFRHYWERGMEKYKYRKNAFAFKNQDKNQSEIIKVIIWNAFGMMLQKMFRLEK